MNKGKEKNTKYWTLKTTINFDCKKMSAKLTFLLLKVAQNQDNKILRVFKNQTTSKFTVVQHEEKWSQ